MTIKQSIKFLKKYQRWRTGKTDNLIFKGSEVTEALNTLINFAETTVNTQEYIALKNTKTHSF